MNHSSESICEERVFAKIYDSYATVLYNYLYYKCGNAGLAQDLCQDAFTKLWVNCSTVLLATAKGFVFKTAKNLMLNTFQHDKVKLKFSQQIHKSSDFEDPAFIYEVKELSEELNTAISGLPDKLRVVFLMSRIDKKTYKEIAETLEISKQGVEKRMYKALDILRKVSSRLK